MLKMEGRGIFPGYRCTITKGLINIIWPTNTYSCSWSVFVKWVDKNELRNLVSSMKEIEIDLEIDKKNCYLPIVKFKRIR